MSDIDAKLYVDLKLRVRQFSGTLPGETTLLELLKMRQEAAQQVNELVRQAFDGWHIISVETDTDLDWYWLPDVPEINTIRNITKEGK